MGVGRLDGAANVRHGALGDFPRPNRNHLLSGEMRPWDVRFGRRTDILTTAPSATSGEKEIFENFCFPGGTLCHAWR
jgi:hypothetical protein